MLRQMSTDSILDLEQPEDFNDILAGISSASSSSSGEDLDDLNDLDFDNSDDSSWLPFDASNSNSSSNNKTEIFWMDASQVPLVPDLEGQTYVGEDVLLRSNIPLKVETEQGAASAKRARPVRASTNKKHVASKSSPPSSPPAPTTLAVAATTGNQGSTRATRSSRIAAAAAQSSSTQAKPMKRKKRANNRKEPSRSEFDTDEEYQMAWQRWRVLRNNNNDSVKRSRENAKRKRVEFEGVRKQQELENTRLQNEVRKLKDYIAYLATIYPINAEP